MAVAVDHLKRSAATSRRSLVVALALVLARRHLNFARHRACDTPAPHAAEQNTAQRQAQRQPSCLWSSSDPSSFMFLISSGAASQRD